MNNQFTLTTPNYKLLARGLCKRVLPEHWTGACVAKAACGALLAAKEKQKNPIIVGLIPFDTKAEAMLYVPQYVQWEKVQPDMFREYSQYAPAMEVYGAVSAHYKRSVQEAIKRISNGELEKVVLTRQVTVQFESAIDVDRVYATLCAYNRNAYVYRVDLPLEPKTGSSVILGASPELILRCNHRKVSTFPLAGSAPRLEQISLDQKAANLLLCSKKDLIEHSLVVRAVAETFQNFADDVVVPSTPELVQTPVMWHLGTHITGQLRIGLSLFELLYALHPTPAVAGWPRDIAQKIISELEGFDRGYFTGLVGWMDTEGNGEWILVLRCGVVKQNCVSVFAGAGIIAGSDPELEHAETAKKMQTFINALLSCQSFCNRS